MWEGDRGNQYGFFSLQNGAEKFSLIKARLRRAIKATRSEKGRNKRNDRLIASPTLEKHSPKVRSIHELDVKLLEEIEGFFVFSHQVEGTEFRILRRMGVNEPPAKPEA